MNSREKAFNKILSKISKCVSRGVVATKLPGVRKVPSSIPGRTSFFFFLLFFSFFFLYVQSSFQFLQFSFISLYGLCFFQIYKFSSILLYFNFLPFSRVLREILRFTYFQLKGLFHSVYCVFSKKFVFYCRFVAARQLWVICSRDKFCVVTQRAADIRVPWLVYVHKYCLLIATLNQHNRFSRCPSNKIRQLISLKMEDQSSKR